MALGLTSAAQGLCDNLLTCICRAWDFSKPCLVAPAMNTMMWDHPFTNQHLQVLAGLGYELIDPVHKASVGCRSLLRGLTISALQVSKALACGDVGDGAMASVQDIVQCTVSAVQVQA